jgi:hypothetical protein
VSLSGSPRTIIPLVDVAFAAAGNEPADQTFEAAIHDGRRLGARIRQVQVTLPRDRFNVVMTLEEKTLLRANHMDLDIYIETTIDDRVYALHCFPDLVVIEEAPAGP